MSKTPELTIYDNRWEILDYLELVGQWLVMATSSVKELGKLGMGTKHQDLLDAVAQAKDQLIRLGDEVSDIVTAVEDKSNA